MKPILMNTLAIIAGIVVGSAANMGIIMISGSIIPPPEGVNPMDMESLKSNMHLFEPKHFLLPFLAHSLGVLVGAFLAALIAANNKIRFAFIIGVIFLAGGIYNSFVLPSPTWFIIIDLLLAYLPFAWIGGKLVKLN